MIYFIIIGILLPLAVKRNPFHVLLTIRIQNAVLIWIAFFIQLILVAISASTGQKVPYALAATLLLLLAALYQNRGVRGVKWIFAGVFANLMALLLHGGSMPVSIRALELAGLHHLTDFSRASRHAAMENGMSGWLGDWIPIIMPLGKNYVMSPGDVLVGIGVIICFYYHSSRRKETL